LNKFRINFISEGSGILENRFGSFLLKQGSIFFTFPGVWHHYKPNQKTGWTENYIGFDGKLVRELIVSPRFSPKEPVFNFGIKEEILDTYFKIFDLVQK